MPRVYTSESNPVDFCKKCYPKSEKAAEKRFGNLGDGPDNRGNCFEYDAEHPPYEDTDYTCTTCDKRLTANDD